ncbi:hypothetical protein AAHB37_03815 [Glutamicibacter halophytocola]|uniref:hypothetical protein n=1 Tax=Glutamicibacter halophytocola TaxID=1933880 RepID=UPI00321AF0AA
MDWFIRRKAAALLYAALSFQEDARVRDKNQQELLNDVHSVAINSASKLKFSAHINPLGDLQYAYELAKREKAEQDHHKAMVEQSQNDNHEQSKPLEYLTLYVQITNYSEQDKFEDISLNLTGSEHLFSIQKKWYRSPLPVKGRQGSIPGPAPQWQEDFLSPTEKDYNNTKYLDSLLPQTQIRLELRMKSTSVLPLEMIWDSGVKVAFGIPPEGEMICRFRDEVGRYWHRTNQSLSDEIYRTWMPEDEPTPKQRRASEWE